jgi:hypothetical protein
MRPNARISLSQRPTVKMLTVQMPSKQRVLNSIAETTGDVDASTRVERTNVHAFSRR